LNIHHFRVVKQFAHTKEVNLSDTARYLASYVSIPKARKVIHQLVDLDIITFEQSKIDKKIK
jgi:hypothetical protein